MELIHTSAETSLDGVSVVSGRQLQLSRGGSNLNRLMDIRRQPVLDNTHTFRHCKGKSECRPPRHSL